MKKLIFLKLCLVISGALLISQNAVSEVTRLPEQEREALRQEIEKSRTGLIKQLDELLPTLYVITHSQVMVAGNEIIISLGQDQTNLKFYLSLRDCNDALVQSALSGKRALSVTEEQGVVRAETYLERENDFKNYIHFQCTEMSHRP